MTVIRHQFKCLFAVIFSLVMFVIVISWVNQLSYILSEYGLFIRLFGISHT